MSYDDATSGVRLFLFGLLVGLVLGILAYAWGLKSMNNQLAAKRCQQTQMFTSGRFDADTLSTKCWKEVTPP